MNRKIKSILAALLALCILSVTVACGEYHGPLQRPDESRGEEDTLEEQGTGGEDTDTSFSVSLSLNGEPYIPLEDEPLNAQWTDGFSFHAATFDGRNRQITAKHKRNFFITTPENLIFLQDLSHFY